MGKVFKFQMIVSIGFMEKEIVEQIFEGREWAMGISGVGDNVIMSVMKQTALDPTSTFSCYPFLYHLKFMLIQRAAI